MVQFMPEYLTMFSIFVGILIPIVSAVTEVIKKSIKNFPTNLTPLLAIVVGLGLGIVGYVFTDLNATWRLWGGLLAGLASMGLYDLGKFTANTLKKPKM